MSYVSSLSTFAGAFREELLRSSVSTKHQQNEEACFQKHSKSVKFSPVFLRFTTREFRQESEHAAEQWRKFCEHEQMSTRLIFASSSSNSQILRVLLNCIGPFDTPTCCSDTASPEVRYHFFTRATWNLSKICPRKISHGLQLVELHEACPQGHVAATELCVRRHDHCVLGCATCPCSKTDIWANQGQDPPSYMYFASSFREKDGGRSQRSPWSR